MSGVTALPIDATSRGPKRAKYAVVGEAPGANEAREGIPFVGDSGYMAEEWLRSAGIDPSEVYWTNVIKAQPPGNKIEHFFSNKGQASKKGFVEFWGRYCHPGVLEHLRLLEEELWEIEPEQILALGSTALWGLTGKHAPKATTDNPTKRPTISKWRGSQLKVDPSYGDSWVIPTFHPAYFMRKGGHNAPWLPAVAQDLHRFANPSPPPSWEKVIHRDLSGALGALSDIDPKAPCAWDTETTETQIDCIGWSQDGKVGHCIPLISTGGSVWTFEQEIYIANALSRILRMGQVIGQNWLFDAQRVARQLGIWVEPHWDTLIAEHVWNPRSGQPPKTLEYMASIYCDYYCYWKEGRQDVDEGRWLYNCEDVIYTYQVYEAQKELLSNEEHLHRLFHEKMREFGPALAMCLRGMRVDEAARKGSVQELREAQSQIREHLHGVVGHALNPNSPKQVHGLLYSDYKLPKQLKKGQPTADADACEALLQRQDLTEDQRNVLTGLVDYRSMQTLLAKAKKPLDWDGRWRCSINLTGTEAFRWSTSTDAFGFGDNLQNMTKGDKVVGGGDIVTPSRVLEALKGGMA